MPRKIKILVFSDGETWELLTDHEDEWCPYVVEVSEEEFERISECDEKVCNVVDLPARGKPVR